MRLRRPDIWPNDCFVNTEIPILTLLEECRNELKSIGVAKIGVFGSVSRQEEQLISDTDILVDFQPEKKSFRNFNLLCDLLDDKIGENYDLVTMDGLSVHFGDKILREVKYAQIAN